MPSLLDEKQVAQLLRCSPLTLRIWRCRGQGPPYLKIGRLVRYDPNQVEAWLRSRMRGEGEK
ncbi:MAG: hypothetical protein KatS3mg007_0333 [Thermoanaerobaculum sp.]|nr:MAG: hypothetical protein KatS3mg007_0333 [Thermoanaerobaculum sp.]GBC80569.1 hypothetical protein HRbin09_01812 [bacterium HR09]